MRKKLFYATGVIVLVLLSAKSFLEYRQYQSYQQPIHADLDAVLKINVDAVIESLLKEYGFNLGKNLSSNRKDSVAKETQPGLSVPANLFIYSLATKKPTTFFCCLPLSNKTAFKNYLAAHLQLAFEDRVEKGMDLATNGRITILCSEKMAAVAYSAEREDVVSVLYDLVHHRNLVSTNNAFIKQLKADRSPIFFVNNSGKLSLTLNGRKLAINAEQLIGRNLRFPEQNIQPSPDTGKFGSIYCNLSPPEHFFKTQYHFGDDSLQMDSLLPYFGGYAGVSFGEFREEQDTITGYEYDDNFQKKEILTLQRIQVPQIEIILKMKPEGLAYLRQKEVVRANHEVSRKLLPLYRFFAFQDQEYLRLTTQNKMQMAGQLSNAGDVMGVELNLNRFRKQLDSGTIGNYVKDIDYLKMNGEKMNDRVLKFHGIISFRQQAISAIVSLVQSFKWEVSPAQPADN